jgi:hypothetical protein
MKKINLFFELVCCKHITHVQPRLTTELMHNLCKDTYTISYLQGGFDVVSFFNGKTQYFE